MENIHEWIKRNENRPLDVIIDSLLTMGFPRFEISAALKVYIDGKPKYHD